MRQLCIFKPLCEDKYEVELGVADAHGAPCFASVCLLDGVFIASRAGDGHITEPGPAHIAVVKYRNWKSPAILYFRSEDDRRRYIDNRLETLKALLVAKHT